MNILVFVGHMSSVAIIQLCLCSLKAATGNALTGECGCVEIKVYFNNRKRTHCHSLPTPILEVGSKYSMGNIVNNIVIIMYVPAGH